MAKEKKTELSFGQLPYPKSVKKSPMAKLSWSGLNYRQTTDTGALALEKNISTNEAPYLTPSPRLAIFSNRYENPIGVFGFDNFLIVIYYENGIMKVDYIVSSEESDEEALYTGVIPEPEEGYDTDSQRCVVQFNSYRNVTDATEGSDGWISELNNGAYTKKLLIFPDKVSMDFYVEEDNFEITKLDSEVKIVTFDPWIEIVTEYNEETEEYEEIEKEHNEPPETANKSCYYQNSKTSQIYSYYYEYWNEEEKVYEEGWYLTVPPNFPDLKYATVHQSRLFGVDGGRIYASGFNDYANWNLDTASTYYESNAWCSASQSNTKADGEFTGITSYAGHVVAFKKDYTHELYNTKNPFRIQDIFAEGTIDNRSIQDVDGRLFFVSDDNVKVYTGSNPRIVSFNLNINRFRKAVSGTDGRNYYLFCRDENYVERFFVYDTYAEQWSERDIEGYEIISFAANKNGMYALLNNGYVYRVDTDNYNHEWYFETDFVTSQTINIKHINKLQMLVDIEDKEDTYLKLYLLYDGEIFNEDTTAVIYDSRQCNAKGKVPIRILTRQKAFYGMKLRAEGKGFVRIYELELFMSAGGDIHV